MSQEHEAKDGPEPISLDRQNELLDRLTKPDHPFENFALDDADLVWLIKWHVDNTKSLNLSDAILREIHLEGARLWGAHLEEATLWGAHLKGADLSEAHLERATLGEAYLERATLFQAHLREASLIRAHLEGARLWSAHLEGADLSGAHLERASLEGTHLERASLRGTHLEGATLSDAHLEGADLRGAIFDLETILSETVLGDKSVGFVFVADTMWNGTNLAVVDWGPLISKQGMLGDERIARERLTGRE